MALVCGACGWSRDYDAGRLRRRLEALGEDAADLAAATARRIAWPCPRCARMRWWCRAVTGETPGRRVSI
jgi:hypothetical protein